MHTFCKVWTTDEKSDHSAGQGGRFFMAQTAEFLINDRVRFLSDALAFDHSVKLVFETQMGQ